VDYKLWSQSEQTRLRQLWPAASWEELEKAFPGRGRASLGRYARFREIKRNRNANTKHKHEIDPIFIELRRIREFRGLTRKELARSIGEYETQLARWENGQVCPRFKHLRKWLLALNCDIRINVRKAK